MRILKDNMNPYNVLIKLDGKSNTILRFKFFDRYNHDLSIHFNQNEMGLVKGFLEDYFKTCNGHFIDSNDIYITSSFRFSSEFKSSNFEQLLSQVKVELFDLKKLNINIKKMRIEFIDIPFNLMFADMGYAEILIDEKPFVISTLQQYPLELSDLNNRLNYKNLIPSFFDFESDEAAFEGFSSYSKNICSYAFELIQNDVLLDFMKGRFSYIEFEMLNLINNEGSISL